MFKSLGKAIAVASVVALGMAGTAHAQKEITVDVEYNEAMLTSEAGANAVLASISRQAITECRTVSLVSSGFYRDEVCELDVIHKAVGKIGVTELASVYENSDLYIEAPTTGIVLASN